MEMRAWKLVWRTTALLAALTLAGLALARAEGALAGRALGRRGPRPGPWMDRRGPGPALHIGGATVHPRPATAHRDGAGQARLASADCLHALDRLAVPVSRQGARRFRCRLEGHGRGGA
jgi:hypothetical protein